MKRVLFGLIAIGMVACSGSSFSSTSGSGTGGVGQGTGGATGDGGTVSSGGQVGSAGAISSAGSVGVAGGGTGVGGAMGTGGGGSSDCETLWQDYMRKLDQARTCSQDGTTVQCSLDSFLFDGCGCPVYVNPNTSDEAQSAYDKWVGAGCVSNVVCPAIACETALQVHCAADSVGTRSVCTGG